MGAYSPNPFAPVGFAGLNDASPEGYIDRKFDYVYEISLTASQALTGETIAIDTDSDFVWRGLIINSDGTFTVRFADFANYYVSNAQLLSTLFSTFGGQPWPVRPEIVFPAGSRITLDLTDLSADDNTGQIIFVGCKRFRF